MSRIKKLTGRRGSLILLGVLAAWAVSPAVHAGVIISDSFITGTVGNDINGRTPNTTDVPGTTWVQNGYYNGTLGGATGGSVYQDQIVSSPSAALQLGAEAGDGIALTGVTAPALSLSYIFNIKSDTPNVGNPANGSGLGFFRNANAGPSGPGALTGFSGVTVSMTGAVALFNNGVSVATGTISGFNVNSTHSESYIVNTTTGAISNLLVDGSSVTLTGTTTGIFTGTNIKEFGITNNAGGYGSSFDYITDATLSSPAVPEPASLGLLGAGAAGLLILRRKAASKA